MDTSHRICLQVIFEKWVNGWGYIKFMHNSTFLSNAKKKELIHSLCSTFCYENLSIHCHCDMNFPQIIQLFCWLIYLYSIKN